MLSDFETREKNAWGDMGKTRRVFDPVRIRPRSMYDLVPRSSLEHKYIRAKILQDQP
jgi:hypothetical protein